MRKSSQNDGIEIQWTQSLGSNKALELLRSKSVDFGSTAGAAALLVEPMVIRSNQSMSMIIRNGLLSLHRAEFGYLPTAGSKGKRIAVTRGTDPHIFLLRALASVDLSEKDIELVPLQHAEGKVALEKGAVEAWSGLDPYTAQIEVEEGYAIFFRNKTWNSYGVLNVREAFAKEHPDLVRRVLAIYEKARLWTLANQNEAKKVLAERRPSFRSSSKQSLGAPGLHSFCDWTRTTRNDSSIGGNSEEKPIDRCRSRRRSNR